MFTLDGRPRLEVTPVVVDGVMYVTAANECNALDAGNGRRLWHYRRPRTKGLAGDAARRHQSRRGGDRRSRVPGHGPRAPPRARPLHRRAALGDRDGRLAAELRRDLGAAGGRRPRDLRHLRRRRRRARIPRGLRPAHRQGGLALLDRARSAASRDRRRGRARTSTTPCAATWLTGTYDPELDTLYWPTGNPCPDYDGDERLGDNLYSDSILALDPKTGRLKWHFQYTPHDVWDWDAQQPPVLVDARLAGPPRKLLLHANRNGFFYVLDRTNGALLLGEAVREEADLGQRDRRRRPARARSGPGADARGQHGLPGGRGRHQLVLDAFHPGTGLYYVQTLEKCRSTRRRPTEWQAGQVVLRRLDATGAGRAGRRRCCARSMSRPAPIAWELPQIGPGQLLGRRAGHGRRAWSSSARTAAPSWPSTRLAAAALAVPDQRPLEGFAHDLRVRRRAARRRRRGPEHPFLRADGVGHCSPDLQDLLHRGAGFLQA